MKKILSIFICLVLLFTLSSTAFAADTCTFTIVVTPAEGGIVTDSFTHSSVSGPQQYNTADTLVNFEYAANEGYHFSTWKKDGNTLGSSPSYAFTLDGDHTIEAVFEKHNYTYKSDENGHWLECSCGEKKGSTEKHTKVKANETAATETSKGYTGDFVCSVCEYVIEKGTEIPEKTSTASKNTGTTSSVSQNTTSSKQSTTSSVTQNTTSSETVYNTEPNVNNNQNTGSSIVVGTNPDETIGAISSETSTTNKGNNNTILITIIVVAAVIILAAGTTGVILVLKNGKEETAPETEETENKE